MSRFTSHIRYKKLIIRCFAILLALLPFGPAGASQTDPAASSWIDRDNVSVRLISATQATGTGTEDIDNASPLIFGLEFQLAKNWKVYWRSPGDAGYPPSSKWATSQNIASIEMKWPAPVRFSVLGFETLGYKNEVVYPLIITPQYHGKPVKLAGEVDFLACAEICIPMIADLSLELPAGEATPSSFAHLINKYSVRVPGDGKTHGLTQESLTLYPTPENGNPVLSIAVRSAPGLPFNTPDVFMEGPDGLAYSKPDVSISEDGLQATLNIEVFNAMNNDMIAGETSFTATILDGERFAETTMTAMLAPPGATISMSPSTTTTSSSTEPSLDNLLSILAIALLGGLILNLMPCVLPVLSIKLLSVIRHGGAEAMTIRVSFLASAAGIITSFLIIAGALATLKSAGAAIGWGIQFQQPWFLITMIIMITVFACNMVGWLEFRLSDKLNDAAIKGSSSSGLGGHFATGMLATVLATPCSAPFLGTAVGFALSRGTYEIMAIFTMLGIGLATPYLVIAAVPRLVSSLPRPGQWMVRLRQVLSIALAGTALWLLSVLTVQIGWMATFLSGGFVMGIVIIIFIANRYRALPRKASIPVVIILAALALSTPMFAETPAAAPSKPIDELWQPFDLAAIDKYVDEGHVVFVDVTAEWCITCQINKTFVLGSDTVFEKLSAQDVITMQADWTLPDDDISQYLASFQRYGIPFNAVYGPAAPQGIILPELLSETAVLEALNMAKNQNY